MKTRLDKLVSGLGYCSRREVRELLRQGRITVAGVPASNCDLKVEHDSVQIDGQPLDPPAGLLLMLHKPVGYACSHDDVPPLVFELLPERFSLRTPPLRMVGRLDRESSGLLLITDSGELVHQLTSPKHKKDKEYLVEVENPLSGREAELFGSGTLTLEGDDSPLLPAKFIKLSERRCTLIIHEGRYHQIRRMFAQVGNTVTKLHRIRVGEYELGGLKEGEFFILESAVEVARVDATG